MTNEEILDLIDADEQATALANAGNDTGLAEYLGTIAPKVTVSKFVTYRNLAAEVGVETTRRLITTINAVAQTDVLVMEFQRFLRDTVGVNIADPQILHPTLGMLAQFVALEIPNGLTAEDATAIAALTQQEPTISAASVSEALRARRTNA